MLSKTMEHPSCILNPIPSFTAVPENQQHSKDSEESANKGSEEEEAPEPKNMSADLEQTEELFVKNTLGDVAFDMDDVKEEEKYDDRELMYE